MLTGVFGDKIMPEQLSTVTDGQLALLAARFGDYFETDPPTGEQVRTAIRRTRVHWPPGSF